MTPLPTIPSSPFVSSATNDQTGTPQRPSHTTMMSPSSDNILDLDTDVLERIGTLSDNCHSSAALLYRWARHPQFGRLCEWLAKHNVTGPYIAWLGQAATEPSSVLQGDLFAVLDERKVRYDMIKGKLNAMADMHEAHNPTSHLHRIQ